MYLIRYDDHFDGIQYYQSLDTDYMIAILILLSFSVLVSFEYGPNEHCLVLYLEIFVTLLIAFCEN